MRAQFAWLKEILSFLISLTFGNLLHTRYVNLITSSAQPLPNTVLSFINYRTEWKGRRITFKTFELFKPKGSD
ncbi:unnamed protein product [Rhizophagus irregularis]|nr:unnamed protein product [Rhizophagus irregularis]